MEFNQFNKQAHLDIAKEITKRQNGLFTFTIRINGKQIVDTIFREVYDRKQFGVPRNT